MISAVAKSTNDLSIAISAATVARVPEDVRADEGLLITYLQRATEIGVMAMAQAGVHLETDVVKAEFAEFSNRMSKISRGLEVLLTEELTDEDSRLARQLRSYLDEDGHFGRTVRGLAEQLSDPTREHSIPGRVRELLHNTFFAADSPFRKALDVADDSSPLKKFVVDQRRQVKDFQEDQVEKHNSLAKSIEANFQKVFDHIGYQSELKDAESKGTRKGGDFEDIVTEVLASAATNKDEVERVGRETIVGTRCKRGDVVIDVHQDGFEGQRIVVETKVGNYTLNGKDGVLNQLSVAMKYRGAGGGIVVVTKQHAGKRQRVFDRLGDNRIVVVVDQEDDDLGFLPLELAYSVLRDAMLSERTDVDLDGPDMVGAEATVAEIQASLRVVTSMKNNCTEAAKNVTTVRESICQMESAIRDRLVALRRQLRFA